MSNDPRGNRKHLGFTKSLMLKVHPDMNAHLERRAEEEYITVSEYLRRLIVADMRRPDEEGEQ